jgi:hypothetical protein
MIIDKEIEILVKSSRTIFKLKEIGIVAKINDTIKLPIDRLWKKSNIKVKVKCDICENNKYLNFSMYNKNIDKYDIYTCSNKCASFKNKKTNLERYGFENYYNIEKVKKTNLERYGVDFVLKLDDIREQSRLTKISKYGDENFNNRDKFKETNLERYGDENFNNRDKFKKTNLERYGTESYSKTNEYLEKVKKTNLERYGVDNYSKTNEYIEKVKKTNLERYGVESSNSVDFIKKKKVLSMLEKYGFISNSMTEESKKRLRETNLERYGVEYPMQLFEFSEKQQISSKKIIYYNDYIYYQGSYEKDFLDHLKEIDLIKCVTRGPSIKYLYEDKYKVHFPDFYIDELNLIVEIKSDYYYYKFEEKNKKKKEKAIELGYNYLFIINKNYSLFDDFIKQKENQS